MDHDPDIQLIPFVATTTDFFGGVDSTFHNIKISFGSFARAMVKVQHIIGYIYIPIYKLFLYLAAPLFAIFSPRSKSTAKELLLLCVYYTWFSWLMSHIPTWNLRIFYFLIQNVFTSIVFVQIVLAHVAMPTPKYDNNLEFFRHQIMTTLDVSCNPWWDWFHGGLNFQIPHHIWPKIARPNLRRT